MPDKNQSPGSISYGLALELFQPLFYTQNGHKGTFFGHGYHGSITDFFLCFHPCLPNARIASVKSVYYFYLCPPCFFLRFMPLAVVGISQAIQLPIAIFATIGFILYGQIDFTLGFTLGIVQSVGVIFRGRIAQNQLV